MKPSVILRGALGAVLLLLPLVAATALHVLPPGWAGAPGAWLHDARNWGGAGWGGFLLLQTAVAASGVLPASLAGVAAGAAFGLVAGFLLAATSTMAGAVVAFTLSRSTLRPMVARLLERRPGLQRLNLAVGRDGWRSVCLLRLSPLMPFAATSYALGLTAIGWRDYLAGTLASMPALFCYVALGRFGGAGLGALRHGGSPVQLVLLSVGALATLAFTLRIGRMAQRGPGQRAGVSGIEAGSCVRHKSPQSRGISVGIVLAALGLYAILICLRMPEIVIKGRFWAEEGQVFFHNAWTMPVFRALFVSFGGYLNLVANGAALLARWCLPVCLAPYLTITTGLLFQLCPPLLLLTARDAWLRPPVVRLAGILLLLLVPASEEVWLQTLHCQFELTLTCAIVLALDLEGSAAGLFRLVLLFLAPLCGPVAIALLPLFLARAVIDLARGRLLQVIVLGAGSALQLLLFFHTVSTRSYTLDPVILLCLMTLRHLDVPLLGVHHATAYASLIRARLAAGHIPLRATVLPLLVFVPIAAATLWSSRSRPAAWFMAGFGLLAAATYFGAIGGMSTLLDARIGERYAFVPQTLLALTLISLAATRNGIVAVMSWIAVIWLLLIGSMEYFQPWEYMVDGPSWRDEVAQWRVNPEHAIREWPVGWVVTLDRRS